ncbi:hypothetical protein J6590_028569 [Homalodisca vitripennis]|nr:hypothetical protein J6590_028569 [Homalodisca vitripennis]
MGCDIKTLRNNIVFEINILTPLTRKILINHLSEHISHSESEFRCGSLMIQGTWVRRLSQDNQIKQRRAWLLLGQVTAERSCPCKRPACPAIGGGSEVTFKPLGSRRKTAVGAWEFREIAWVSPG